MVVRPVKGPGVGIGEALAGLDVDEDPVGLPIAGVEVVDVGGGHDREVQALGEPELRPDELPVSLQPMVLELEVEPTREDLTQAPSEVRRLLGPTPEEKPLHPRLAGRKGDQALPHSERSSRSTRGL